jgi:hypothetical protein
MLPVEYQPTEEYISLFQPRSHSYKIIAIAVSVVAEQIKEERTKDLVLSV